MASPWQDMKLAVLGCGFMGTAILQGLSKAELHDTRLQMTACVRSRSSLARLEKMFNDAPVQCLQNNFTQASEQSNVIILGVPPDQLQSLLGNDGLVQALRGKVIISLLAGVSCEDILQALTTGNAAERHHFNVVRTIPTIASKFLDSVTLLAQTTTAGEEHRRVAEWLLAQIGTVEVIPESLMDTATAMGAACHALAVVGIEAAVDASVAEGLPRDLALAIAAKNIRSGAGLAVSGMTPEGIKSAMSIPHGITIHSFLELERGRVRGGISDTVRHAIKYTNSMSS
ncbi:hypothetical protein KVT40_007603 [Elsinoe batatas]|uniref:Pyrroline-5-carboxylate reductase n=1 Tax=Elsinoe batatas TaxID=2601811 RepID=A0A8K0KV06_9PEZI|nr:hypothetical protein KVT40_007603 [Elsinoe batatas]